MSKSIQWNQKGHNLLSPMQRDAFERGESPRRLEGKLERRPDGSVWLRVHGAERHLGDSMPDPVVPRATGELDAPHAPVAAPEPKAPPAKSRKVARKRKAK